MKSLLKCWGENILKNGVEAKIYLSYKITKGSFKDLNNISCKSDLNQFDYAEITLNQITERLVLEFNTYNGIGANEIIELQWSVSEFFKLISNIEMNK